MRPLRPRRPPPPPTRTPGRRARPRRRRIHVAPGVRRRGGRGTNPNSTPPTRVPVTRAFWSPCATSRTPRPPPSPSLPPAPPFAPATRLSRVDDDRALAANLAATRRRERNAVDALRTGARALRDVVRISDDAFAGDEDGSGNGGGGGRAAAGDLRGVWRGSALRGARRRRVDGVGARRRFARRRRWRRRWRARMPSRRGARSVRRRTPRRFISWTRRGTRPGRKSKKDEADRVEGDGGGVARRRVPLAGRKRKPRGGLVFRAQMDKGVSRAACGYVGVGFRIDERGLERIYARVAFCSSRSAISVSVERPIVFARLQSDRRAPLPPRPTPSRGSSDVAVSGTTPRARGASRSSLRNPRVPLARDFRHGDRAASSPRRPRFRRPRSRTPPPPPRAARPAPRRCTFEWADTTARRTRARNVSSGPSARTCAPPSDPPTRTAPRHPARRDRLQRRRARSVAA